MTKILLLCALISGLALNAQEIENSSHKMTIEELVKKVRKAGDPKNLTKNCKSMRVKLDMQIPMQNLKLTINAIYKFPSRSKIVTSITGMPDIINVTNEKEAWQVHSMLGIKKKTGISLEFAQYKCNRTNPSLDWQDSFESLKIDPKLHKANGYTCYMVTAKYPKNFKLQDALFFVDTKEFLLRKATENEISDMGKISATVLLSDYKNIAGLYQATTITSSLMGIKIISKLKSIKLNIPISDNEFKFPKDKD